MNRSSNIFLPHHKGSSDAPLGAFPTLETKFLKKKLCPYPLFNPSLNRASRQVALPPHQDQTKPSLENQVSWTLAPVTTSRQPETPSTITTTTTRHTPTCPAPTLDCWSGGAKPLPKAASWPSSPLPTPGPTLVLCSASLLYSATTPWGGMFWN